MTWRRRQFTIECKLVSIVLITWQVAICLDSRSKHKLKVIILLRNSSFLSGRSCIAIVVVPQCTQHSNVQCLSYWCFGVFCLFSVGLHTNPTYLFWMEKLKWYYVRKISLTFYCKKETLAFPNQFNTVDRLWNHQLF